MIFRTFKEVEHSIRQGGWKGSLIISQKYSLSMIQPVGSMPEWLVPVYRNDNHPLWGPYE